MNLIIKDNLNDRRIEDIKDKYINFVSKSDNKSSKVLLLVPNNKIKYKYDNLFKLDFSEEIKSTTYISFISKEIIKFWPIIDKKCNSIINHRIKPSIISNSLSDYIINEIVKEKRNLENYFQDITASNRNISSSISYNINKAAQSLMDLKSIGNKIYYSKSNRDKIDRFSYTQMQEIIDTYTNLLLENSIVDNSLLIYLYNEYLLKDEYYLNELKRNINYLIVDSLENCPACEVDLISKLLDSVYDSHIYINETKDYASFNNVDMTYTKKEIFKKCKVIENDYIEDVYIKNLINLSKDINLNQSNQLYSEMVVESINKVIQLIKDGYEPKDIAIISPVNSTILDYQVKNILLGNKVNIYNTKKDKRIIDYPYAHALMVASCIFYECEELLNEEDYICFISLLLNKNKIKSLKIARDKYTCNEYIDLLNYIEDKKDKNISINEFLIKFYIDKLLNLSNGKENVKICKKIIQESENFTDNISLLGFDRNKTKEKIFIEALKTSIKDYYSLSELEEFSEENSIVMTTPYTYISHNMNHPIQIWLDIGSNMWSMKSEKEISNVQVLKKSFDNNQIYTEDIEEFYKEYYLYNTVYNLLLNTKKVYAYKSEYTVNGYIQEGLLYSLILKLINKGDFNE
ncbi:MAG: hypothetical protein E7C86_06515 [Paeniclostridium sordellii]|uniref:Uncharacterized protein n=1 Tax=Paeniclostridium hominis TaxID=2764329 RepID=A0ABR7JZ83_9FIRM|nr:MULTISPECIES: hypothetical protein [Paeniclostridium]MBC6002173.1 hypothetical protein [Paeniclostridium hominis]MDU2592255.1 hypothetical protein [Paeniclostridium sordellii]